MGKKRITVFLTERKIFRTAYKALSPYQILLQLAGTKSCNKIPRARSRMALLELFQRPDCASHFHTKPMIQRPYPLVGNVVSLKKNNPVMFPNKDRLDSKLL